MKSIIHYISIFCISLTLFSCGKEAKENRDNQVFRFNQDANVSSLDPAFAKSQDNIWMCNQLFNGLVQLDDSLNIKPDYALIDGNQYPKIPMLTEETVVKGDAKSMSIAAASILAKVSRDRFMLEKAKEYPQYQFEKHKGYGTKLHYEALRQHGPSPIHRLSFLRKMH